jgi:glycosyltransferase involved in cell wall biosynthesis
VLQSKKVKKTKLIFYVDPMSYGNLGVYDFNLINKMKSNKMFFFGNINYDYKKFSNKITTSFIFSYSNKGNNFKKLTSYLSSMIILTKAVFVLKPETIHIQWIKFWFVDLMFLLLLKIRNINVVYTAHNLLPHKTKKFDFIKYKIYYNLIDKIIVHSYDTKSEFKTNFNLNKNIHVIEHGILDINISTNDISLTKTRISEKLKLKNKVVFSVLGYQDYYKGCDIVRDMWSQQSFFSENDNFQLIIWGKNKGIDYSILSDLMNVNIRDEYISNEEFVSIIQLSSAILMPYRDISQSGLLLTAISEGVPVIVSKAGGLREVMKYGKVGEVMNNLSPTDLMFTIQKFINNSNNRVYNNSEFSKVKKEFSWDKILVKTESLYNKM